jgi:hypothetical protein
MAMLCALAFALAPLASASLHMRFATALTFISASVLVLCQYDVALGYATSSASFLLGRFVEVSSGVINSSGAGRTRHGLLHSNLYAFAPSWHVLSVKEVTLVLQCCYLCRRALFPMKSLAPCAQHCML